MLVCRFFCFDLHRRSLVGERANEAVAVAILRDGDRNLGLDYGVDATDLVRNLPGALEEKRVVNVALFVCGHGG